LHGVRIYENQGKVIAYLNEPFKRIKRLDQMMATFLNDSVVPVQKPSIDIEAAGAGGMG
jgi:hypothetical protein